jgi:hypothetical protein
MAEQARGDSRELVLGPLRCDPALLVRHASVIDQSGYVPGILRNRHLNRHAVVECIEVLSVAEAE